MIILYPFSPNDEAQANKNADWICSLRNNAPLRVVLVRDKRCTSKPFGEKVIGLVDVRDRKNQWPESPNQMFEEGARYMEYMLPEEKSFLWLEPDAVPICDGWLDKIIAERNRGYMRKKPFLGAYVPGAPGQEHLSGVAVYPNPVVLYSGLMLLSSDTSIPFDLIDGVNVVRQSHFTDLIQNRPRQANKQGDKWIRVANENERFKTKEDFYRVATKECVLFHSDKHGDLIDILRNKERPAETRNGENAQAQPVPQNFLPTRVVEQEVLNVIDGHPMTLQDHVAWLKTEAETNGYARMRVYKALINAGLREKKGKKK